MFQRPHVLCAAAAVLLAGTAAADESTTVGGRIFADLTYIDQKSDDGTGSIKTDASGVGTDVKRGYLIVRHRFDDVWSVNLTTDFNYSAAANYATVFVKKAYVQAKLSDAFVAQLGAHDLPWIPYVEDLYGYRYVEKMILDRLGFGTSADWGVNVNGGAAGRFNYSLSAVNGNGYRNPSRSRSVDAEGRVGFVPLSGLTLAAGFYDGKLGQETQSRSVANTARRLDALVSYMNAGWRVGGEYFVARNFNAAAVIGPAEDKADGYSAWVSYDITPRWGVFARADGARPSRDLKPSIRDRYYNAGVAWHANRKIDLALAVKHEKVDNGVIKAGNGDIAPGPGPFDNKIGGSVDGTYTEAGVWILVNF